MNTVCMKCNAKVAVSVVFIFIGHLEWVLFWGERMYGQNEFILTTPKCKHKNKGNPNGKPKRLSQLRKPEKSSKSIFFSVLATY